MNTFIIIAEDDYKDLSRAEKSRVDRASAITLGVPRIFERTGTRFQVYAANFSDADKNTKRFSDEGRTREVPRQIVDKVPVDLVYVDEIV